MSNLRRVFVTRNNKTNFHSLFEVIPSFYERDLCGTLDLETMNALVQWKKLDGLIKTLAKTGPVASTTIYKKASRMIPISDAIEIAEANGNPRLSQGFGNNDASFLRMQLYLDGFSGGYPSKASVERCISKYGLLESNAVDDLRAWGSADPNAMVAVEPIADLVYIRNLCSICLRIVANYQNGGIEKVLEASGFKHVRLERRAWTPSDYRDSYYVIPFQHNVMEDKTINFSWKWGANVFAYMVNNPLSHWIRSQGTRASYGTVDAATILTSPDITGIGRPLLNRGYDYENADTREYLALNDDMTQREVAERFIQGVGEMFSSLQNDSGEHLGWDFKTLPALSGNDAPTPVFHTLASAMVGTLIYRHGTLPAVCKNCGNGMLIRTKGKRREFCSDSCRSQYSIRKGGRIDYGATQ